MLITHCAVALTILTAGTNIPGEEFAGARAIAMGQANRAFALDNAAIFLNPAGMAMAKRYSIDVTYMHRFDDNIAYPSFSLVDSKTTALSAGIAYTFERAVGGKLSNHHVYLSLAYPLGNIAAIGITTKYMRGGGSGIDDFNAFTGDVGAVVNPIGGLHIGVVGYNLIDTKHDDYLPILLGVGVGYLGSSWLLAFDFVTNLSDKDDPRFRYHAGAEYFLAGQFPLRIGYQYDGDNERHRWCLGAGWVAKWGAIDIGYRQDAHRPPDRELTVALRFFL